MLHVQGLNMSTQLGGACRFCWTTRIHQARHTDDYWRVVQLELCSCSCLPAVLVAATCTGFVQDVHTARYLQLPLPDDPEKTQANNHSAELKQFSCLRLPASCLVVVVTAARKGFTMSQAKYKLIYVYRTDTLEQVCRCPIACCATRSAQWQLSAGWCGTCCMYAQGWCNMLRPGTASKVCRPVTHCNRSTDVC
jgi:hypothetical protein